MSASVVSNEEAQLAQTIEMFEVITESQPLDYQSLEILKEAYSKVGRQKDTVRTSKRIAQAYLAFGQLSSAILEYESILQQFPDDPDVQTALAEIENKASNLAPPRLNLDLEEKVSRPAAAPKTAHVRHAATALDDGKQAMEKIFVESKLVSHADFEACWPVADTGKQPRDPLVHTLNQRQILPLQISLPLLVEKSRLCHLPLERYDVDVELARGFSRELCYRWCILPFDRMSKSILVATVNPFNKQAAQELQEVAKGRLLWYLVSPGELLQFLRKLFR